MRFLLLAIIIFAGCTNTNYSGFQKCLSQCDNDFCKDGCRFEQAENSKSTLFCDELNQKSNIPECYGIVAIAANDISICNKLSGESKNHCISAFSPR